MADASVSKTDVRKDVRVRLPLSAPPDRSPSVTTTFYASLHGKGGPSELAANGMRERTTWSGSRQRGQAVVEFALASVVFTLLLGATVDLGHAFFIDVTLHDAAREGARHGVWFNVGSGNNPYLDDSDITAAVNDVLTHDSLSPAVLQNGGTTCPTATDGNAYDNPPYATSAAPSTPGATFLYICYDYSPGTDHASPPADNSYELQDVNVILVHRLSPLEGFLPQQGFGSVIISENQHMAVQGN